MKTTRFLSVMKSELVATTALLLATSACANRNDESKGLVDWEAQERGDATLVVALREKVSRVDVDAKRIYWVGEGPSAELGSRGSLRSCLKDDCLDGIVTYMDHVHGEDVGPFVTDGDTIFWATDLVHFSSAAAYNTIVACPTSGCDGEPRVVKREVSATALALGEHLYWTRDYFSRLFRCSPGDCEGSTVLLLETEGEPRAIRLDATHAYWIEDSTLRRAPLDDFTQVNVIAKNQDHAYDLGVSGGNVYWTNRFYLGPVSTCPVTGCDDSPSVVAADQIRPWNIAVSGAGVFWTTDMLGERPGLYRCPANGCSGDPELVGSPAIDVAVDEAHVYWSATDPRTDASGAVRRRPL